jgi:hypothetical protein
VLRFLLYHIHEALRTKKKSAKYPYWHCEFALFLQEQGAKKCCSNNISRGRRLAQIYWRYTARATSLVFPELVCEMGSIDQKQKYGYYKTTANGGQNYSHKVTKLRN